MINTIQQLKRCHFGTPRTKAKCASLREIISKQATKLMALILEEKDAIRRGDLQRTAEKEQLIENMLGIDAPFSMLMRDVAGRYR